MSKPNYDAAKAFFLEADSFEACIMAAVMKADSLNRAKLFLAWPEIVDEVHARYDAPGGLLPHEIAKPDAPDGAPMIYVTPQATYGSGDVVVIALAEDGHVLASHFSSNEYWARHDMGLDGSNWKHDVYDAHYPEGWHLTWVPTNETADHLGFQEAYAKNQALKELQND